MSAEEVPGMKQLSLDFAEIDTNKIRLYEFAVLVTSLLRRDSNPRTAL